MPKIRTFIAVAISREAKEQAEQFIKLYRDKITGVKWVHPESLHLTLKFLGDIWEEDLPDFTRALDRSVAGMQPFQFSLEGVGSFPNWKKPRVIWVGVDDTTDGLLHLHRRIEEEFAMMNFPREKRAFHPHLTLARVKDIALLAGKVQRMAEAKFARLDVQVQEVLFMKSQLLPEGARYSVLHRAPLLTTDSR